MNPLWIALSIPIMFILVGSVGRKLTRGTAWERGDFYFGPQLCLATFSADTLFLTDIFRQPNYSSNGAREITGMALLALVFFIYMFLLSLQQDWQNRHNRPKTQLFWLVVLSNVVGSALFAVFVIYVKGATQ
jgi:hypothetical protein